MRCHGVICIHKGSIDICVWRDMQQLSDKASGSRELPCKWSLFQRATCRGGRRNSEDNISLLEVSHSKIVTYCGRVTLHQGAWWRWRAGGWMRVCSLSAGGAVAGSGLCPACTGSV